MNDQDNYYKILEIPETATQAEIKKAYRRLSLLHHPDKNAGKVDVSGKFQKINTAYETLGDEEKRMEYDDMQNNPFGTNFQDCQGIDELLASLFFGGMGNMRGTQGIRVNMNQRSSNMSNMSNMMNGQGAFMSQMPGIKIFRHVNPNLEKIEKPSPIIKHVTITMSNVLNGATVPIDIERWIIENNNKIFENETLYVTIPKGVDENEIIILKDKGHVASHDCIGDVKIFIKIEQHDGFKRSGLDLIFDKNISLKESLCGFSFELKHLNDKTYTINNTIGNIIKPEYKKIIPNMGLERDGHKGNIIIFFHVIFPEKMETSVLEKLKELL
jgi:DnaJ family protein A protein 2